MKRSKAKNSATFIPIAIKWAKGQYTITGIAEERGWSISKTYAQLANSLKAHFLQQELKTNFKYFKQAVSIESLNYPKLIKYNGEFNESHLLFAFKNQKTPIEVCNAFLEES